MTTLDSTINNGLKNHMVRRLNKNIRILQMCLKRPLRSMIWIQVWAPVQLMIRLAYSPIVRPVTTNAHALLKQLTSALIPQTLGWLTCSWTTRSLQSPWVWTTLTSRLWMSYCRLTHCHSTLIALKHSCCFLTYLSTSWTWRKYFWLRHGW